MTMILLKFRINDLIRLAPHGELSTKEKDIWQPLSYDLITRRKREPLHGTIPTCIKHATQYECSRRGVTLKQLVIINRSLVHAVCVHCDLTSRSPSVSAPERHERYYCSSALIKIGSHGLIKMFRGRGAAVFGGL